MTLIDEERNHLEVHTMNMKKNFMTTKRKRFLLVGAIAGALVIPTAASADEEFGDNTWMYEDDAWYDVSEWFDGNDYNPTDEAIGRWDDEIFHYGENATSSDNDNFLNYGDYGYANSDTRENDWFYDYYDDGYLSWNDRYYTSYYDIDDDGLYDAMASYADTDGDGLYEDFDYVAFNDAGQDQQTRNSAQSEQKRLRSSTIELNGKIAKTKKVSVRDRQHVVAMLQRSDGQAVAVDMGRAEGLPEIKAGTDVTATGHALRVGDKIILVATKAQLSDQEVQIDRSSSKLSGTVERTKKVTIKGKEHAFAKINTANNKSALVDLGLSSADNWLKEGQKITIQGVPTKVNDRVLLMARQFTPEGGETMKIDRQMASNE